MRKNVSFTEAIEQKKKNDALCKKLWRTILKENPVKYEQYKVNERYRKLQNKENKAIEVEEAGQCSSSPDSPFSNKQTLRRSLCRADNHLPKSPHQKAEVIEILVEQYHVKILFNTKRGRPRKDSNEEEKKNLKHSFLAVTLATPTLEGKIMYMLAKLMVNVAIRNVCIYCGIYVIFWTL